ncbi:hypothetical protein TRAPUB_3089 [Trametes pubescens]|uniref:Uncharacterized protein n=1 Tax=Trametes pubescens TaxID=154538 RepID=A0A1M2VEJ2_TRAPU|nr:hypothetical protein TRAPUB_3089 [Trametes pubescens]
MFQECNADTLYPDPRMWPRDTLDADAPYLAGCHLERQRLDASPIPYSRCHTLTGGPLVCDDLVGADEQGLDPAVRELKAAGWVIPPPGCVLRTWTYTMCPERTWE